MASIQGWDKGHSWRQQGRVLLQEWVRPTLADATLAIDREVCPFWIQLNFDIFSFQALADVEGRAEQMDLPMRCDLSEEGDPSRGNAQGFGGNNLLGRQFADLGSSAMLH